MQPVTSIGTSAIILAWISGWVAIRFWILRNRLSLSIAGRAASFLVALGWVTSIVCLTLSMRRVYLEYKYRFQDETDPSFFPRLGVPLRYASSNLQFISAVIYLYVSTLYAVKGAFITLYFDISSHLQGRIRYGLIVVTVYVVFCYLATVLTMLLWCRPISQNWSLGPDYCTAMQDPRFIIVYTVLNVTSDFAVMLIPIYIIRTLQLRQGDFWAIAFLLFLGVLTMCPTAVRAGYLRSAVITRQFLDSQTGKQKLANIRLCEVWSFLEMAAAMTAICLPSLRVLLHKYSGDAEGGERRNKRFWLGKGRLFKKSRDASGPGSSWRWSGQEQIRLQSLDRDVVDGVDAMQVSREERAERDDREKTKDDGGEIRAQEMI